MLLYAQARDAILAQQLGVLSNISHAIDPALGPALEGLSSLALFMILAKEGIVTLVISLHRRRMRPQRHLAHSADQEPWNNSPVRVRGDDLARDDLFRADDHFFRCAYALEHNAEIAPAVRVAVFVGALQVDDCHVWDERP